MAHQRTPCYCINLRRAANAATAYYDSLLEPLGLTVNQFSLLASIDRLEQSNISELAGFVGLERTTLTRTLRPLMDRGLIRDESAAGARDRKLRLTQSGQQALERGMPEWKRAQREIESRLGIDSAHGLYDLCEKLQG